MALVAGTRQRGSQTAVSGPPQTALWWFTYPLHPENMPAVNYPLHPENMPAVNYPLHPENMPTVNYRVWPDSSAVGQLLSGAALVWGYHLLLLWVHGLVAGGWG